MVARILSEMMGQILGQPFVIEDRAGGAAGLIGSDAVAKSAPDGLTLLINSNAHVIAPGLVARMPYDVLSDFASVAHLGNVPQVLVVNPQLPATNMADLPVWLRANSGRINFASAGIGSGNHLASEIFRAAVPGVEMEMVQHRGGGPAMQSVIAGTAHMCVDPLSSALPHIRGGTVRAIAVAGAERAAKLPEIPSATEAGLPAWDAGAWFGAFLPARTPPAVIASLNSAFNMAMDRLAARLAEMSVVKQPTLATSAAFDAFMRADLVRVQAILRRAGVQAT